MVTFREIEEAYARLKPVVHKTPLLSSKTFDLRTGNQVVFKAENFQRVGAFKIRGAYNKISTLSKEEKARGVVTHSSGNHAQGVALAAQLLGVKAVVVMPRIAPHVKVEATRGYGAEVIFCEDSSEDRERVAKQLVHQHGYSLVPPFDDERIIAGAGTAMLEVGEDVKSLDYVFCPIGGGGLISGTAIAAKRYFPSIKVIGVETEAANDCYQTFRQKRIVRIDPPKTIADGMRTQSIGQHNFEIIMKYVDDVITVTDAQVLETMKFFLERMKIVVEPTGAVASAAVHHNILNVSSKTICAMISGGNVAPELLKEIL
jgi:threo-3-hydroxy-L-aspartate ammonia-lyase